MSQNLIPLFQYLQPKPRSCMPRDVTMHEPDTRIIRLECESEMSIIRQHGNVTSRRIVEIELWRVGGVEACASLRDDGEVVAVKMDGVRATCHAVGAVP